MAPLANSYLKERQKDRKTKKERKRPFGQALAAK